DERFPAAARLARDRHGTQRARRRRPRSRRRVHLRRAERHDDKSRRRAENLRARHRRVSVAHEQRSVSALVPLTNSFSYATNLFANAVPVALSNLTDGAYTVYALGMNSAAVLQNSNAPAISKTWIVQLDTDGDGLPDAWEQANGTDPNTPDANADPDLDGLTNLQEYRAGTIPTDASSTLRLDV